MKNDYLDLNWSLFGAIEGDPNCNQSIGRSSESI